MQKLVGISGTHKVGALKGEVLVIVQFDRAVQILRCGILQGCIVKSEKVISGAGTHQLHHVASVLLLSTACNGLAGSFRHIELLCRPPHVVEALVSVLHRAVLLVELQSGL